MRFFDHWSTHRNIHDLRRVFQAPYPVGVSSRICIVTHKSKSVTYTVASSFVCTSQIGGDHCCWSSGYSSGLQFCSDLSCSACASRIPNLPQIIIPLVSLRMPLVDTKHAEARRMKRVECGFVLFSELEKTFCHFPRVSAHCSCLKSSNFGA